MSVPDSLSVTKFLLNSVGVSQLRREAWRRDARSALTGRYDERGWSGVLPVNWETVFDGNAQGLSVAVGGLGEKGLSGVSTVLSREPRQ